MVTKKNKDQLNITISPYLKRKMDEIIGDKAEFTGYSDLGTIAIAQFIERYKPPKERMGPGSGFEPMSLNLVDVLGVNQQAQT